MHQGCNFLSCRLTFEHLPLKTTRIPTEKGNFTVQLLGKHGDWVICWPAQLNDHESMKKFGTLLAKDFRVVLCDPPAVGLNRELPYSHDVNDMVYFAQRMLTKLGVQRCHWVGQSAGGVVGVALQVANPARIQSITLASAPMLSQGRFKVAAAASRALLAGSRLGRRLLVSRGLKELGYGSDQEKKLTTRYLSHVFERMDPKTIRQMQPLNGASVRSAFDKLRTQHPPLLVLCGRHDHIVLPRDQSTVAEITQSHFVDLPCGHLIMLAQPEACAGAFQQFVQKIPLRHPKPRAVAA
jgi:pimeloyl-ACP methyl ester carboxylesterase